MSVHSSLRTSRHGTVSRNVLKRHERVRRLVDQGRWEQGQSVLGLPKVKQLKMKARKAAPKEKTGTEKAAAASPTAAPAS
jgi:small basic protein (TIGR04137 family)